MSKRRVVITGLGIVSPVGSNIDTAWRNVLEGKSGIVPITRFDASAFPVRFHGAVADFDAEKYLPAKKLRNMDPFMHYGYAAAKAGMVGFSKSLAREVGSRNITVNCVAPGFIDTDMTRALSDEQKSALLAQIPLGRLGAGADIAAAVAYLASPAAGYVTGTVLHVNGGMYMS